ncbi:MAG: lysophospholipid acyltransferase family protein [Balneolales bacterium]
MSLFLWVSYGVSLAIGVILATIAHIAGYRKDPFKVRPNRYFMALGYNFVRFNPFWEKNFLGLDKVDPDTPTIFVGNHQSFMDMPLLAGLPFDMKWVSKIELFKVPVVGWLLKMGGHIGVKRGNKEAIKSLEKIKPYLDERIPVMIFPEGTRSRKGELKKFKNGAFIVAKKHNYLIQPIVIHGTYDILPPGDWRVKWKGKFFISILDPIIPSHFETMEQLRDHTCDSFKSEINRLKVLTHSN